MNSNSRTAHFFLFVCLYVCLRIVFPKKMADQQMNAVCREKSVSRTLFTVLLSSPLVSFASRFLCLIYCLLFRLKNVSSNKLTKNRNSKVKKVCFEYRYSTYFGLPTGRCVSFCSHCVRCTVLSLCLCYCFFVCLCFRVCPFFVSSVLFFAL